MSKRLKVVITSYITAAFVVVSAFAVLFGMRSMRYERMINSSYQSNFAQLSNLVNDIDANLQKGLYAGTATQIVGLSSKIWNDTAAAKQSLSNIPFYSDNLDGVSKYLSQTGDFVYSLAKKVLEGGEIGDEDRQSLIKLREYASELASTLSALEASLLDGTLTMSLLESKLGSIEDMTQDTVDTDMHKLNEDVPSFPKLIYDGPFSEHIESIEPGYIKNMPEQSEESARKRAASFLGIPEENLSLSYTVDGALPLYAFSSGNVTVEVSKKGGFITSMVNTRQEGEGVYSYDEALKKAADFLSGQGFTNMQESYYENADGILLINFEYTEPDGTVCYPDLVKVGVALSDLAVVRYEAAGYAYNHKEERDTKAALTMAQAQEGVSSYLTVKEGRKCIILSSGKYEKLCYEFSCTADDGTNVLVYINADTGFEEDILILIIDENGILTL